jgi:biopolymer transport protein ExbB
MRAASHWMNKRLGKASFAPIAACLFCCFLAIPGTWNLAHAQSPSPGAPANAISAVPLSQPGAPASPASPDATAPSTAASAPVAPASAVGSTLAAMLPHDLSLMGMFFEATFVVKAVIVGLIFASLVTWTLWLAKTLELRNARRSLQMALETLSTAASLSDIAKTGDPVVDALVREAYAELGQSAGLREEGVSDRVAARLERVQAATARRALTGTNVLATIGSSAPFVGLFGTVWGIMTAFIGISQAQTTSLMVVAPGIAEALLATAFGLIAAIPAVIIYNGFARVIAGYRGLSGDAATLVLCLAGRDLDRRGLMAAE